MIAADKKALKASLQQSISQILQELVDLYSKNLNSLGVQTSAIAGLSIAGIYGSAFEDLTFVKSSPIIVAAYYSFMLLAILFALGSVMLSTIAAQYGPSLALTGKNLAVVAYGKRIKYL
jgi:hypothetical protein